MTLITGLGEQSVCSPLPSNQPLLKRPTRWYVRPADFQQTRFDAYVCSGSGTILSPLLSTEAAKKIVDAHNEECFPW